VSNLLQNKSIAEGDNEIKKKIIYYKNQESNIDMYTPISKSKKLINKENNYFVKTMENNPTEYSDYTRTQ
jgi:hypothetical protein